MNSNSRKAAPDRIALTGMGLARTAFFAVVALGISGVVHGQDVLWDHVGNGVRMHRPTVFTMLDDFSGDGAPEIMLSSLSGYVHILPSEGGAPLVNQTYPEDSPIFTGGYGAQGILGDLTGDGAEEYSLSVPGFGRDGTFSMGKVVIFDGRSHEGIGSLASGVGGENFGRQVATLGDINGDGILDHAIGSSWGPLRIYAGPDWTLVREHFPPVIIAPMGDVDMDGHDDYALGFWLYGPLYGGTLTAQGKVDVISGVDGSIISTAIGQITAGAIGLNLELAGDWNGDGVPDFATGSGLGTTNVETSAMVFSGADGSLIREFKGNIYSTRRSEYSFTLASGHDINGDGVPDLVVGAMHDPWPSYIGAILNIKLRGAVYVFSGASGALLWEQRGVHAGQRLGTQVEVIEDFDGDGLADWAVLSEKYDLTPGPPYDGPQAGRLTIYGGAIGDAIAHCSAGSNSDGETARLWNSGPISVQQNRLELALSDMPPSQMALVIHGQLSPPIPFGAGELCIGTPLSVLGVMTAPAGDGFVRFLVDLQDAPFTNGGNVVLPGDRWSFQAIYRDQGTRNTSNALEVTFLP